MRRKVLIITNHSYMMWRFRKELVEEIMKTCEVVLSMPFVGHEEDFQAMGLRCIETKVDRRGINPKTDLSLIKNYDRLLRKEQPDLVITYSIKPNIYAGWMCAKHHIPFYANVQGMGSAFERPMLSRMVTVLYRSSFRQVKKAFFENGADALEFEKRGIISREREVILNGAGINLDTCVYAPYPHNETFRFLYLGRIMKEKGMDELFSAVKQLKKEGFDFILDLVGFYEDGYQEQVKTMEEQSLVSFHGFKEDPIPYYVGANCVVMPSYHEGMSNVNLEAAAVGRPLITTDIPGCREAVEEGKTGLLVAPQNEESLYSAMKQMLAMSTEQRETMGRRAREKMRREFSKESVVEKTMRELNLER